MTKQKESGEVAALTEQMKSLEELYAQERELQAYIREAHQDVYDKIDNLEAQKRDIDALIRAAQDELTGRDRQAFSDLTHLAGRIKGQIEAVKRACYHMPNALLAKSQKFKVGGVNVSISKATVTSEYRAEELLAAHPELEEMYVDGDPVVGRTINATVLDRLVARGDVEDASVARYRVEVRAKNPSVSITVEGAEDAEPK